MLWIRRTGELPRWIAGAALVAVLAVSGLMAWTANLGGQIRHSEIRVSTLTDSAIVREEREGH